MIQSIKNSVHRRLPDPWYTLLYVHRHYSDDPLHTLAFLFKGRGYPLTFGQRFFLLRRMYAIWFVMAVGRLKVWPTIFWMNFQHGCCMSTISKLS